MSETTRSSGFPGSVARRVAIVVFSLVLGLAIPAIARPASGWLQSGERGVGTPPQLAIVSLVPVERPRGLIVTTGGWLYCANTKELARAAGYSLLCGRYAKDEYTSDALRAKRHLDWGNPLYLAQFAREIARVHRLVGGPLIFLGVSYSGFGMAALASRHPSLRPDRLIVVDSYLDLVARRRHAGRHPTGKEIDLETGGSRAALTARSVDVEGLAKLVRQGTVLAVIWSISAEEKRLFRGATCARDANAETLAKLARVLGEPVSGWVTNGEHGFDLWNNAQAILHGHNPGRRVEFSPRGLVPAGSYCG